MISTRPAQLFDHKMTTVPSPDPQQTSQPPVRSLKELMDLVSGRSLPAENATEDFGLAEELPFPFLALVGQSEMKTALLLAVINPAVGGVLLIGPRGTGKTTAVRSLADLLPHVQRSTCFYGCLPEDIETGGIDAVCPDCAKKYGEGLPLSRSERARLVELPLNARLEDVIGGLDERAAIHARLRLKRGILAQADQNLLFVDEVNLLANDIADSILDAAAQGSYTIRRGPISATYRARFTLIGSMNPEEGRLRPQIMDRFGLRVPVHGLQSPAERLEAYHRVRAFLNNPRQTIAAFAHETALAANDIEAAREMLKSVVLPAAVTALGTALTQALHIDSLRAEISLFEAARAFAAADSRTSVTEADLLAVAPLALRMRRSAFMTEFFKEQELEDSLLKNAIQSVLSDHTGDASG